MKKIIKKILASSGYKIERVDNPNPLFRRHHKLIQEHYECYRELIFKNLPPIDEDTTKLLGQLDGTQISEAIYLLNALQETKQLPGDVCEFGVAQGFTSALIADTIKPSNKNLWLFDSFQGLPAPTEKDILKDDIFNLKDIRAYQGTMKHGIESVSGNLKNTQFPESRVFIVDGFIEDTIKNRALPKSISFAYVDFDFYNPIKVALEFLDQVVQPSGIIMVDDYDFFSEGAKIAVDEFFAARKEYYQLTLPMVSAGHFALLKRLS